MANTRFDRLTRTLHSRRGALQTLVGAGAAFGFGRSAQARPRPACFVTGEKCDPNHGADCCTGSCKKHKGKHKCSPVGEALGCTTDPETDYCRNGGAPLQCPDHLGGICVVVAKQQPLCVDGIDCVVCQSDADCIASGFGPTGRCVKQCALCEKFGLTTACVSPSPPPP